MENAHKYRVGLVQMRMGADPDANLESGVAHIREAAKRGANIICLPELFRAQYFCQREDIRLFDLAEPIPGPSTSRLSEVARELRVVIVASLFERRAAGLYHNTAVTLGQDGSIISVYRKMHIPDDPLYYEKFYFTPGDLGFKAVDTPHGRVGTLVCWDQWYPEGARLTALQGAEVLFYPTAIGWHPAEKEEFGAAQYDAWQTIQRARQSRERTGAGVLGRKLSGGPVWTGYREGIAYGRRDSHRRDRSGTARRYAPQLAVSSRPADRCVRADYEPVSGC
jgi:N-carbamoylputrescine amidase